MFKKILRICSFLVFSFCITTSAIFTGNWAVEAIEISQENTDGNSLGIVIEETIDSADRSESSSIPDLGDDQAFPFIPGFGKNSGKD